MVDKKLIEKTIDNIIKSKELIIVKCKPSYRPSVLQSFQKYADQYGFTMKSYKDNDIYDKNAMVTLYDPVHNTGIEFSKDFINENLIDFQNTNKKKINIEDIFNAYDQLPDKCKDSVGLIKHTVEDLSIAEAWATYFSDEDMEFNRITIPSYYVDSLSKYNDRDYTAFNDPDTYGIVLAHESMHCRDYMSFTNEEKRIYVKKLLEGFDALSDSEEAIYNRVSNNLGKFTLSNAINWKGMGEVQDFDDFQIYLEGFFENREYLNLNKGNHPSDYNSLNKASDYGNSRPSENFAEYGAMVINGYHNPTNPNARIKFNGEWMQYQEWARLHPYTVQYIVKDLYGEEPSIDDILADTIPTRYGEYGVKIEDLK